MKVNDMLFFAVNALMHAKLRTWLTIIGIIIGIFVVVILFSLGDGVKEFIKERLAEFGANIIEITPGTKSTNIMTMALTSQKGRLTMKDVERIEKIVGVGYVMPLVLEKLPVRFKNKEILGSVYGIGNEDGLGEILHTRLEEGRLIKENDGRVALIGNAIAHKMFGKYEVKVGNSILIGGKRFRVVGILEKRGGMGGGVVDNSIFIPLSQLREITEVEKDRVDFIEVVVKEGYKTDDVGKEIEEVLRLARGETRGQESFAVWTSADYEKKANEILDVVTMFLGALGGISLLVGGVGIMNTMFMSVYEKTKAIGIMKAIGATNKDVLMIFLIESAIIGAVGGAIGIILSLIVIVICSWIIGIKTPLDPIIFAGAFLFSLLVGMLSGLFPSWKATQISPAEALRYE